MIKQHIDLKSRKALQFLCPACLKIPKQPVQCSNPLCSGIFCYNCISFRIGKPNTPTQQCPYSCIGEDTFQVKQFNDFELEFYDNFETTCDWCKIKIKLMKFRKHSEKCQNKIQKQRKQSHDCDIMEFNYCSYYGNISKETSIACHKDNFNVQIHVSEEQIIKLQVLILCQFCLQYLPKFMINSHVQNNCLETLIQCDNCESKVQRKSFNEHSITCIEQKMQKLKQNQIYYGQIQNILSINIYQKGHEINCNLKRSMKLEKKNIKISTIQY